jgi:TrmH family RNA methyltransferase
MDGAVTGAAPKPGRVLKISSLANPMVKAIASLHQKKRRDETGLFLAEGMKLVRDAAEAGWAIRTLLHSGPLDDAVATLAARAKAAGGDVLEVPTAVLQKIARRDNPQTVLGVFSQRFASLAAIGRDGVWVALDRVRDPGNLGTIVRTVDAAGLAGVALVGACVDPFAVETVRATMGSIFSVPVARASEEAFISHAKGHGLRLVGTHLSASLDYRAGDYREPLVLLLGNEQQGLTDRLAAACDALLHIPMRGRADSLNLAVSAGILIYEALRTQPPPKF